jgi:hypothetical protein
MSRLAIFTIISGVFMGAAAHAQLSQPMGGGPLQPLMSQGVQSGVVQTPATQPPSVTGPATVSPPIAAPQAGPPPFPNTVTPGYTPPGFSTPTPGFTPPASAGPAPPTLSLGSPMTPGGQ